MRELNFPNSETILNSLTDGVIIVDLDKNVKFINEAAKRLLGINGTISETPNKPCHEIIGHSMCSENGCIIMSALNEKKNLQNFETSIGINGNKIDASITTSPIYNEEGEIIGGVEIIKDISLLKQVINRLAEKYSFENIIGRNHRMRSISEILQEVAPTNTPVLIAGETGSGKEFLANVIHENSSRNHKPFVKAHCGGLTEKTLESELFGHYKASFSGEVSEKKGRLELADQGTIFLDDINKMPLPTQEKLLSFLKTGEFIKIGEEITKKSDVRIIAASNTDLKEDALKGRFNEELLYRLNIVSLNLPPLRERKDDIPLLIDFYLKTLNRTRTDLRIKGMAQRALDLMVSYDYPGNISELKNIMEHAFTRCKGTIIYPQHLTPNIQNLDVFTDIGETTDSLKQLERTMIRKTLENANWDYKEACKKLNISRTTLWRKMKALGIDKRPNTF